MTAQNANRIDEIVARINEEAAQLGGAALYAGTPQPADDAVAPRPVPFVPIAGDGDLMQLPDVAFVQAAYRRVLGRDADQTGLEQMLLGLRSGSLTKADVLISLRWSGEGRQKNAWMPGLNRRRQIARLFRVPLFGPMAQWLWTFMRLRAHARENRRLDAQIGKVAFHAQQAISQAFDQISELKKRIGDLTAHAAALEARVLGEVSGNATKIDEIDAKRAATGQDVQHLSVDLQQLSATIGGFGGSIASIRRAWSEQRQILFEQQRAIEGLLDPTKAGAPQSLKPSPAARETSDSLYDALYVQFENAFRGSFEEVKQRQQAYLPLVSVAVAASESDLTLDLGCGRGEFLEVLREAGYRPRGIDVSAEMVAQCTERGLNAEASDAIRALAEIPANSLAMISGFHIVEHVPTETMLRMIDEIFRVLRPGGLAILETPNTRNILVGAGDFYRDPTHRNPVFPDTLAWFGKAAGFESSHILYVDAEKRRLIPAEGWSFDRLEDYVTVPRDYAWIGTKPLQS